ncbi:MAG: CHAT domain-containing protein [bacterium]
MPVDLLIRPSIPSQNEKVLYRLAAEFDHRLENREPVSAQQLLALGTHLWEALVAGVDGGMETLLALREQALAAGTHVRLQILAAQANLQALPWELAFHADPRLCFLSRNANFTLLRRWQLPEQTAPAATSLPLRLLLFISSPEDLDPEQSRLDFETEQNFLFEQLDDALCRGWVKIDVAEDGTLETLQKWLEQNEYHAVHLSMHGLLPERGEPLLLFEQAQTGRGRPVTPGELLSEALKKSVHAPPLVFLSACQTAQPDTQRALPGFAQALLQEGVPHVVGMRRSVADRAATNFAGHFYHALATGKDIDRALLEARQTLPQEDTSVQWSVPVLYSRKPAFALVDRGLQIQAQPVEHVEKIQIGGLLVTRAGFVGRRAAMRRYFRDWATGKTRHLWFSGLGGVGKTALVGHFALRLRHQMPDLQLFAFVAPFRPEIVEEQLWPAFDQAAKRKDLAKHQALVEPHRRLPFMLNIIAHHQPCLLIFDNLETCLELSPEGSRHRFLPEYSTTEQLLAALIAAGHGVWSLFTCRYPVHSDTLHQVAFADLPDASPGDMLRFMQNWSWPSNLTSEDKKQIYRTFGGNFRSVEWLAGLLTAPEQTWPEMQRKVQGLRPPTNLYGAERELMIEAMRRNLLFDELLVQLRSAEKKLLQHLGLETLPVFVDALHLLWQEEEALAQTLDRLAGFSLLETADSADLPLPTYRVPPLVVELLKVDNLPQKERQHAHVQLGKYWRHAGSHLTQLLSDDWNAIAHFDAAESWQEADALRSELSGHYYGRQNFRKVEALLSALPRKFGDVFYIWNTCDLFCN